MAASANPSGNNQESNGNGGAVPNDTSAAVGPTQAVLRHNPGLAVEWTADEQSLLEDLLNKSVFLQHPLSLSLDVYTWVVVVLVFFWVFICRIVNFRW